MVSQDLDQEESIADWVPERKQESDEYGVHWESPMVRIQYLPLMKRLLKSLFASAGALALVAAFGPTDAAAQQCRSSSSYGYSSGYGRHYTPSYHTTRRYYVAPVRRSRGYTSARIVVNPHYGNGSIYYRGTSRACPPQRYYTAPRRTIRYTKRSRGGRCYRH